MALTASQRKQIHIALLDAFTEQELRALLAFELETNLDSITAGNLGARVYDLVDWADRHGRVPDLVRAAAAIRTGNTLLGVLADNVATWMTVERLPEAGQPPYLGLHYYDVQHAPLFFGRSSLTEELVRRLQECPFLAIVGASGSGKSSLARAGLIPVLRQGNYIRGSDKWLYCAMTPSARPLAALAACLHAGEASTAAQEQTEKELKQKATALDLRAANLLAAKGAPHLFLLVDQLEEVFTHQAHRDERSAFLDNLVQAAKPNRTTTIVMTLRADFYAACAEHDAFRTALEQHQKYIGAMTRAELREAIEQPAQRGNWDFEGGLVDELLKDAGAAGANERPEPSSLPLLSHALLETWQRRNGRTMTFSGYAAAGGVTGAIAKTAEDVYRLQLSESEQKVARRIFLRLVALGDGVQDTRRRAGLHELYSQQQGPKADSAAAAHAETIRVLDKLATARLVTTDSDEVEIIHEALIREWPTLRDWLDDDRADIRLHRRLTQATEEWFASGGDGPQAERDSTLLWEGGRLRLAETWAAANQEELSEREHAFLKAARRHEEAAQRQQRGRLLLLRAVMAVALVLATAAVILGYQWQRQSGEIESRRLAGIARSNLSVDPQLSILLAGEALKRAYTDEAEEVLRSALQQSRLLQRTPLTEAGVVRTVFNPDHSLLALQTDQNTIEVRTVPTGTLQTTIMPGEPVRSLAFAAPQAATIATGGESGMVRLWDLKSGRERNSFPAAKGAAVSSLAFSPQGDVLVTGSYDYGVRLWSIDSETAAENLAAALEKQVVAVSLAFHPNGNLIVIGGYDGTLRLADLQLSVRRAAWQGHQGFISTISFAPDGGLMATGGGDGKLKVWNTSDLALAALPVQEQTSDTTISAASFSANGRCVAAGGYSQDILVWDLARNKPTHLLGANQVSFGVDFGPQSPTSQGGSPDGCGNRLLSASADGELLTWNIGADAEYVSFADHASRVEAVAVDPRHEWFATADDKGEVLVWKSAWSLGEPPPPVRRQVHDAIIYDLAVSPDGSSVATASTDGAAKVLETDSWTEVAATMPFTIAENFTATLRAVAFHPDLSQGLRLATGHSNGAVSLWEATSGRLLKRWEIHQGADPRVNAIAFNAGGTQMLTSSFDGYAYVWDMEQETVLHEFRQSSGNGAYAAAFSPDQQSVLLGDGQGRLHIWSLTSGEEVVKRSHQSSLTALEFSPDGKFFATSSLDRTVVLWNSASYVPLRTWQTPNDAVSDARFAHVNGMPALVATNSDGMVRIFLLEPSDLLNHATERLEGVRKFSLAECQQYLNTSDCPR